MPELPDLEVLKEVLNRRVVGREISTVRTLWPGILKTMEPPLAALEGKAFSQISRRAKLLTFTVRPDLHAVVHLMLRGRFVLCQSDTKYTKATGLVITFTDGEDLRLIENGPMKLAAVHVTTDPQTVKGIANAGLETLSSEFTVDALASMCAQRRRQAKKLLTDQRMIAGIGTAYADEVLFSAEISPIRYVNTLSEGEITRLHGAIRTVLGEAIDVLRARTGDRLLVNEIRDFLKVYKHTGEPCPVCGDPIAEIRYAQTRTYYCPTCQSSGKLLKDRRSWLTR